MHRPYSLWMSCALALAACGTQPTKQPQAQATSPAEYETKSDAASSLSIDYSRIETFEDYDKAKSEAYARFENAKSSAFEAYEQLKGKAFDAYYTYERQELARVRAGDAKSYLAWLDAKERGDFAAVSRLEEASPLLEAYNRNTRARYAEYETADKKAYDAYRMAEAKLYDQYEEQDRLAYSAYTSRQLP